MLSLRAHGNAGLRSWIFYAITLCIRAFHMTSIVISLYFKQENCETLISLYNWGQMKHCQSALVSCKVEWFCSLLSFHGGLASLIFSVSPSVSSSQLCASPFSEKQRKSCTRRGREVRIALLEQLQSRRSMLCTCSLDSGCMRTTPDSNQWQASPFQQRPATSTQTSTPAGNFTEIKSIQI